MPLVTLVDPFDREIGRMEKAEAHKKPTLHRAFSVFLVNPAGDAMLLQRRAKHKYHSGGLWTNACCSHPAPGEDVLAAAWRRMREELGIDCAPEELFHFVYCHEFSDTLYEYEYDHVLLASYGGMVDPNPEEADLVEWVPLTELLKGLVLNPLAYTPWFLIAAPEVLRRLGAGRGTDEAEEKRG